jgi:GNAT superfamily N-acetyltransferase
MPVRLATADDLDVIAAMGQRFFAGTRYAAALSPSHEDMRASIGAIFEHGRVWVAEIDGVVRGFLAVVVQPVWFSPGTRIALETAWWMDEEHRGRPEGVRLLFEFERWAKEQGAKVICMSDIVLEGESAAERILTRLGYRVTERTFTKGLQ